MTDYLLHGLRWRTDVDLHQPGVEPAGPADVELTVGAERPVPDDEPAGVRLAQLQDEHKRYYTISRHERGEVVLRFHGLLEAVVTPDLRQVTAHLAPGADADFVSVLATGTLASTLLVLRGHPVLHGSAVAEAGAATALVAAAGMGKSTLATLLCRTGAAMITDDVLRVDLDEPPVCRSGGAESRLRARSAHLGEGGDARGTGDGRSAVRAVRQAADRVPLAQVLVPYPSRAVERPEVTWLGGRDALLELARFPRISGWSDPATSAQHFQFLAQLVRRVPVARVRLPWSDRVDDALAGQLRSALCEHPPAADAP